MIEFKDFVVEQERILHRHCHFWRDFLNFATQFAARDSQCRQDHPVQKYAIESSQKNRSIIIIKSVLEIINRITVFLTKSNHIHQELD